MSDQGFDIHSRTVAKPRHITGDELIARCMEKGFPCFPYSYLKGRSNCIRFGFRHDEIHVDAVYSTVTGMAIGTYSSGIMGQQTKFDTDDKLDGTPWFDALLAFLYRE